MIFYEKYNYNNINNNFFYYIFFNKKKKKKKDKVAYFWPTYAMIDFYAHLYGCKPKKINYDSNLNLSLKGLIKTCKNKIKILFIANPNQPTGTILDDIVLKKIINL